MTAVTPLLVSRENPATIFDGAHADHVEVLPWSAGVAVPGVVADVDEDFGAELGEVADFVGKHGLVADEDAVAMGVAVGSGESKDFRSVAARELRDTAGELAGEEEDFLKGMYSPKGTRWILS